MYVSEFHWIINFDVLLKRLTMNWRSDPVMRKSAFDEWLLLIDVYWQIQQQQKQ